MARLAINEGHRCKFSSMQSKRATKRQPKQRNVSNARQSGLRRIDRPGALSTEPGVVTRKIGTTIPPVVKPQTKTVKYLETLLTGVNMSTSGAFTSLSAVSQGVTQGERLADTIWVERIDLSFAITTANADIFNLARVVLLRWNLASALALPTTAAIFSNWSNALVHSFQNFERRKDFTFLHDVRLNMTGVATNPTINSQHLVEATLTTHSSRIDFDLGSLNGVGNIYLFLGSDSVALPFPVFTGNFRLWYYDD